MNEITTPAAGELTVMAHDLPAAFGSPDALDKILSRIEQEARSVAPDLTTAKGRKAVASLAYKVAQAKTALDEAGKSLNAEARARINAVDAERRRVRDRLDKLRDEIRAPLDAWGAAEDARLAALRTRLDALSCASLHDLGIPDLDAERGRIAAVEIGDDWQEVREEAQRTRDATVAEIDRRLIMLRQAAELKAMQDRLAEQERAAEAERAAAAERDRLRMLEAVRAEAEREEVARMAAEAERQRIAEIEASVAAERAAAARAAEAAAQRERELQAEVEEARRRALEAAEQERQRIVYEAEMERRREEAEAARQAAIADAQARAVANRARLIERITAALEAFSSPRACAEAIVDGHVPNVAVTYDED